MFHHNSLTNSTVGLIHNLDTAYWGFIQDTLFTGTTTALSNTGATNMEYAVSLYPNKVFYHAAAPADGTWIVGDRVINSVPASGQPKAWVCTVAGSPGTWTSEGNL